jgi:predicted permease
VRFALARALVRAAARLAPSVCRREWREEWLAELDALERAETPGARDVPLPGALAFSVGALPHALWTRIEEWTMDGVLQDLGYAARRLWRTPGFTLAAALTLALGIGANASIFSFVNGLLFRSPAGIEEPERLVQIGRGSGWDNFSWPAMKLIEAEASTLEGVAGYSRSAFVLGTGAEVERVSGQYATGAYFDVLGARPFLGRLLQPSDAVAPGAHSVAVISHGLWLRRFGGDPAVIGRAVPIGARPYEIVGVAQPGFTGVETVATPSDIWIPMMQLPEMEGRLEAWSTSWIRLVGRLASSVDFAAAEASMEVVSSRLREAAPNYGNVRVLVANGVGFDPGDRTAAELFSLLLLLIVGAVLLLTCTNLTNLFLARASAERTEVGVRMALGAGRGRLARQLLTETLLLAGIAVALALPLLLGAGRLLPLMFPYPLTVSVAPDARAFAFLVAIGGAAGLLVGALPAWGATRRDVAVVLREGASTAGRPRARVRDSLVVAQLALSLALVSGAALLGRSVANARDARPGFEPAGLTAAFIDLAATGRYDQESGLALYGRLLEAASRIPGVRAVTIANQAPITGGHSRSTAWPFGREDVRAQAEYNIVGPDYFETLGIPILSGRALGSFEEEPEHVVVVNDALARMFWPGEDAVGKELAGNPPLRVVGVAGDVQMRSLGAAGAPGVYHPLGHEYRESIVLHVRGEEGRAPDAEAIRAAVAALDPALPVSSVVDLHATLAGSMGETRMIGYLLAAFAALALVLAAVGLYGVVAFGASQRVRELGIRMALGAQPGSLVRLVLARGIALSLVGAGAGLLISYALGWALAGLLFGVSPGDLRTLAAATAVLLITATLAAWLPARRASRVDAVRSLRE